MGLLQEGAILAGDAWRAGHTLMHNALCPDYPIGYKKDVSYSQVTTVYTYNCTSLGIVLDDGNGEVMSNGVTRIQNENPGIPTFSVPSVQKKVKWQLVYLNRE